jgi:PAS domain S-box-containing protein
MLQIFAREARWVLDFQACSISLIEGGVYHQRILPLGGHPGVDLGVRPIAYGAVGRALQAGQALILNTLNKEDAAPEGMQSALIVPLRSGGLITGAVSFFAYVANRYGTDDLRIAYALTVQISAVLNNARLFTAVARARDELNTVLESISDAVLVVDVQGRVVLMNTAWRTMLHLPDQSYAGLGAAWLLRASKQGGRRLLNMEAVRSFVDDWRERGEGRLHLGDGRHVEWVRAPLVGTGKANGFVLTARDISARIKLEELRDDMIAMLVHDLRTPLTGVMLGVDLLKLHAMQPDSDDYEAVYQQIRSSAHRLLYQVNTILDVRKMEAGRMDVQRDQCDVQEIFDQALAQVHPLLRQYQQQLVLDLPGSLPPIIADATLLRRVLENLLGNAHKFTPRSAAIVVGARVVANGQFVEFFVQDSGPGVPESMRERIFEKYGQASALHAKQGTGLGLTFCKLAVEAHGGAIGVRSAPTGGSLFWFTVPMTHHEVCDQP